ncbi:hypothetical protein J3458_018253 [Metarhizium acridum]|uniref:uncharacterized protein n=1 Tax=Metarhizium acridum TaxID=92637 RepID=UPI001C6BF194|nr:hypothetical protein J3458_018253 [Metarhizium acridum]
MLLFSAMFMALGKSVVLMLLQYVTKTFGWSWAKAGVLMTIKKVASISLATVVLPAASQLISRIGMAPLIKDWWILRASAVIGAVGSLAMAMAPTVLLFIAAIVFTQFWRWHGRGAGRHCDGSGRPDARGAGNDSADHIL